MRCENCGAQISQAQRTCPGCGALLPSDFNYGNMENELLNTVYEDENMTNIPQKRRALYEDDYMEDDNDPEGPVQKQPVKLAAALLVSVAVFGGVAAVLHSFSTEYAHTDIPAAYQESLEYMTAGDYAGAGKALEPLLQAQGDNLEYLAMRNTICEKLGDQEGQIEVLNRIIELDEDNYPAYVRLIELYLAKNDQRSIAKLAEHAPNNTVMDMLEDYLVDAPVLELTPGVYDLGQELTISGPEDLNIYYTLDGSDPAETGKLYYDPIILGQGHTVVRAVCRNENGVYGEEVTGEYEIVSNTWSGM